MLITMALGDCGCPGLYTIRCRTFKEQLAVAAEGLSVRLLDEVRSGVRHSNLRITEEYQVRVWEALLLSGSRS